MGWQWQDAGDVRKGRGGKATGKDRGKGSNLSAKDAKHIALNDPEYKSVDPKARKLEKKQKEDLKKHTKKQKP